MDLTGYEPLKGRPEQKDDKSRVCDAAKGMPRGSESAKLCHEGGDGRTGSTSSDELREQNN